jgi:3-deoxy-D-manno-octulosonic-acid transferase
MTRSLGLTLYSLVAGRDTAALPVWPERPAGSLRGLGELARRLREEDGYGVVLTTGEAAPAQAGVVVIAPPPETEAGAAAFLEHWRPDLAVIADGELRPILLTAAADRRIPLMIVDGRAPYLPRNRISPWPGLVHGLLERFSAVVALDEAAARQFRRRGAPEQAVRVEGRMADGSCALPCTEAERAALVRQFRTRPVWLAASLPEVEEAAVIAAHRSALRMAHRLLLILVPDRAERSDRLAAMLEASEGWQVARRSSEEEPDDETQVYIADAPSEMGLWYRLAPVTFMGGSLYGAGSQRDPFEAAALGSAILHGPRAGIFGPGYARLTEARASRPVGSPADLAEAMADLMAPDRTARLAQAAWAVASAGAEVTDRIVLAIRALVEERT